MSRPYFFSYHGKLNEQLKRQIILEFRDSVKKNIGTTGDQKKCAYILQEAIDNIMIYYKDNDFIHSKQMAVSCSIEGHSHITLNFTNELYKRDATMLKKKIQSINSKSPLETKAMLHELLEAPTCEEHGAHLGLLSMLIKSHNTLKYRFTNVDDNFCTFDLTIAITI